MKLVTSITHLDLNRVGENARRLEASGMDGVTTQENKHDPYLPLAVAATHTNTIGLRTSIAIAFARSPMPVANLAWDLQSASNGRFTLGLGSQVRGHNLRRFSVPWSAPAPRMREYVQALSAIFRCWQHGERLNYKGEHYQFSLMTPNFCPDRLECALPRIHIAAVGPAMLQVAAQECDGVMLHGFCTRKYLEEKAVPRIMQCLQNLDRTREEFEISGGGFLCTGPDDQAVQEAFEWLRMRVGFYGSTPSYWPVLEVHGLEELGRKLNALSKQGKWEAMTQEVDDDTVSLFCARGRYDEIGGAVRERFGGLVDVLGCPADLPPDLIKDLQAIPTGADSAQ